MKRKQLKRQLNNQQVTLSHREIEKIKAKAVTEALKIILPFALLALRDEFQFGKVRLIRFYKKFMQLNEDFNNNYFKIEELTSELEIETGIKFSEENSDG